MRQLRTVLKWQGQSTSLSRGVQHQPVVSAIRFGDGRVPSALVAPGGQSIVAVVAQ